jgi:3-oxoacid CoA-transferase subunit A
LAATNKVFQNFADAVGDIPDGASVMIGGFAGIDRAYSLIRALRDRGSRDLTIISNGPGGGGKVALKLWGIPDYADANLLVEGGQVKHFVISFSTPGTAAAKAIVAGDISAEFVPQGTLAERIRAGGFGIGGFYVRTGVGTEVALGKETKIIDGQEYLLEMPIKADYALIRAYKADTLGNLVYHGDSRNFNAVMAAAARVTIAEVEDIVPPGELDPETVVTPGIFVNRIVKNAGGPK